jgi:hypothetical protein
VNTLALSAGRHWLEASAPEADRLALRFDLSPADAAPAGAAARSGGVEPPGARRALFGQRLEPGRRGRGRQRAPAPRAAALGHRGWRPRARDARAAARVVRAAREDARRGDRPLRLGSGARERRPRLPAQRVGPPALQRASRPRLRLARRARDDRCLLPAAPRCRVGASGLRSGVDARGDESRALGGPHSLLEPRARPARDARLGARPGGSRLEPQLRDVPGLALPAGEKESPSGPVGCRGSECRDTASSGLWLASSPATRPTSSRSGWSRSSCICSCSRSRTPRS